MVAHVVGLNQKVVTKLSLKTKVPSLCIWVCIFALELVVTLKREDDRENLGTAGHNGAGDLCIGSIQILDICQRDIEHVDLEWWIRTRVTEQVPENAIVENTVATSD